MNNEEVIKYFNGDDLAASVWQGKYAFEGEITPDDMHMRLATHFTRETDYERVETLSDYGKGRDILSLDKIYQYFRNFQYIVPQGSIMSILGSDKIGSLSNCFILGHPEGDSYGAIMQMDEQLTQLMKRRGGCIEENTPVIIKDRGVVAIKDVNIGDYILSYNIVTGVDEYKLVKDKYYTEVDLEDQVEYVYNNGVHLKTSKKHPILNIGDIIQYKKYDELSTDHYNKSPNFKPKGEYSEQFDEIAWLIGLHLGDGTSDKAGHNKNSVRLRILGDNESCIKKYKDIVEKITGSITNVSLSNSKIYKTPVWQYNSTNQNNQKFIDLLDNQTNDKTYIWKIPSYVNTTNFISFLCGLIDADGYITKSGRVDIAICSKNAVEDLSKYLTMFGQSFQVSICKKRENEALLYKLHIHRFGYVYEKIKEYIIHEKKKQRLIETSLKHQSIAVKLTKEELNILSEIKKTSKVDNNLYNSLLYAIKKQKIGIALLFNLLSKKLIDQTLFDNISSRTKIEKINIDTGQKFAYIDIEVEGNNNYYAGIFGFVNIHNCGIDISTLRPNGTKVSNAAGSSTGAVSFMERFSSTTREVAQSGRRGALMISIDVRHPDVFDFVTIKQDPTKVTGANVSVHLRNDFMDAVKTDGDYILRWPCETTVSNVSEDWEYNKNILVDGGKCIVRRIKAKELWDLIIKCAHATAEPGLMFLDNHWDYAPDTVYPQYKSVTTNPCSEIMTQKYDSCRLMAMNMFSFVNNPFTSEATFDFEKWRKVAYEQQVLADILVDLEIEHIERILEKIKSDPEPIAVKRTELELWEKMKETANASRRTGCGFTALGDTLAAFNLKYDSDESLEFIEKVLSVKFESELNASIDLAIRKGTFGGWTAESEFEFDNYGTPIKGQNPFYQFMLEKFPETAKRMALYGRRNVSTSTVAPTGSLSLLTQTTSGLEPVFMVTYTRRKKVNPGENVRVDFVDQNGDCWMEYAVMHPKFIYWYHIQIGQIYDLIDCKTYLESLSISGINGLVKKSPWNQSTANDINWVKRVQMQGIIQKYVTHSISSTINLPNDVSVEEVSNIYLKSWEHNLKGVTVYRDGCRSGVMISNETKKSPSNQFSYNDAIKRPKELPCTIHNVSVNKEPFTVVVGLLDQKPYEVFVLPAAVMKDYKTGLLSKKGKGTYTLTCSLDDEISIVKDITANMTDEQEAITRLVSTSLRHGADVKFICEQLLKTKGGLNSFTKAIARVLKKHVPDGEKSGTVCESCGSGQVIYEDGCQKCIDCGASRCS